MKAIKETEEILNSLKHSSDRLSYLKNHPSTVAFFKSCISLEALFSKLSEAEQEALYTLTALDQGEAVLTDWNRYADPLPHLKSLAASLTPLMNDYRMIGGIAGYLLECLKLLGTKTPKDERLIAPKGLSLSQDSPEIRAYVKAGILSLPEFAEVYPVGGAGDRLDLYDETGKTPLPQAKLKFHGYTLLEGMIHDLIARERLYFNLTGERVITPIALMTSPEKDNRKHIEEILEEKKWFFRPKELFYLFDQPLVPMLSETGKFATKAPLTLNLKPGGHGIIWELMETAGVFKWLDSLKRDKILLRQINNPLAGCDKNLLALAGKGALEKKAFGFLSCPRLVGTAEGMNAIVETQTPHGLLATLTNIEYTDLADKGIKDEPENPDSPYSPFPANTNILFAHIPPLKEALKKLPLPGLILNLKGQVTYTDKRGKRVHSKGGRLETTMQNIADALGSYANEELQTFILFNCRRKTLSATKKKWNPGEPVEETPQGAFETRQKVLRELFTEVLGFDIPEPDGHERPNFILDIHPALGPLWEIIGQKVQKGSLAKGSELSLYLEKLHLKNLTLDGSLLISSPSLEGTAYLKNVTIRNRGVNYETSPSYWQGNHHHKEKLEIILHGSGEFYAEDLTLEGPLTFEVPTGHRMIVKYDKGKIKTSLEKSLSPSWKWLYNINSKGSMALTFKS